MEKTYNAQLNMWQLTVDADHILHKVGYENYDEIRRIMVRPTDVEMYEEVAVADIPPYTEAEYKAKVEELIRERYSASDEFALINNMMSEGTVKRKREYAAYQDFREECKSRAKQLLSTPETPAEA